MSRSNDTGELNDGFMSDDELDAMFAESEVLDDDEYFERLYNRAITLDQFGWQDAEEFIVNLDDVPEEFRRNVQFETLDEAIEYLSDGGILGIGGAGYDQEQSAYEIFVDSDTGSTD